MMIGFIYTYSLENDVYSKNFISENSVILFSVYQ